MGIVFGSTGSKEPAFKTLRSCNIYEIREYGKLFIAEIEKSDSTNNSFKTLAKYIGVFGEPQNRLPDKPRTTPIAMTAPVLTTEKKSIAISMTAPVISNEKKESQTMAFVLPEEYKSLEEIPIPTDSEIKIKVVPARVVAVIKFSGWYTTALGEKYFDTLSKQLYADRFVGDDKSKLTWSVAQYHPPFTIPFLRRNEVWIDLEKSTAMRVIEENAGKIEKK
jgi:hypothetical protein